MAGRSTWSAQKIEVRCERCDGSFETTVDELIERSRQWCDNCLEHGGYLVSYRLVYRTQRTDELLVRLESFRHEASNYRRLLRRGHGLADIAEQTQTSVRYVAHLLLMEKGAKEPAKSKE